MEGTFAIPPLFEKHRSTFSNPMLLANAGQDGPKPLHNPKKGWKEAALLSNLFWDYGVVWVHLAQHSQEAWDWKKSIDAFQRAVELQKFLPSEFWNDYGSACLALATLLRNDRLLVKA